MEESKRTIAELIFHFYIGAISSAQQQDLDNWLKESPQNQKLFQYIIDSKRIYDKQNLLALFDQNKAWQKVQSKTTHKYRIRFLHIAQLAAIAILSIGLGFYLTSHAPTTPHHKTPLSLSVPLQAKAILSYENQKTITLTEKQFSVHNNQIIHESLPDDEIITLTIPRGGEFLLTLDDGSEVWLNSESELKFPRHFNKTKREVSLTYGEAYFNVRKNPQCPFQVISNEISLEVLGTEFNLQNYQKENNIITTLINGSVRLSNTEQTLIPGQQAQFDKTTHTSIIQEVDTRLYTSWREGRFIFKSMSLDKILRQISRWYDVEFKYETEELKHLPFSGNIRKYDNGNTILEILMETRKIRFEQKGDFIYVQK